MEIGANIRRLREKQGLTQEQLAEKLDVSFQAISSWERGEYLPEASKLIRLAAILKVPIDNIVYGKENPIKTKKAVFNWEHMKTYVKTTAQSLNMTNTLKALFVAYESHKGKNRKNSDIPYIYHPLSMACHALSMGIKEDEVIAAILLHDTVEDDKTVSLKKLPVNDQTKDLVGLLTKEEVDDSHKAEMLDRYYAALTKNPKTALIKCIDRCNNLSTMSWGFVNRDDQRRYIIETDKYYPEILKAVKSVPEYSNAYWLLKYQIESMLDIYNEFL